MAISAEEARFLNETRLIINHVADPANDDSLQDLLDVRGDLIGGAMYDDPDTEGLHELGELSSEELDYLEAVEAQ